MRIDRTTDWLIDSVRGVIAIRDCDIVRARWCFVISVIVCIVIVISLL